MRTKRVIGMALLMTLAAMGVGMGCSSSDGEEVGGDPSTDVDSGTGHDAGSGEDDGGFEKDAGNDADVGDDGGLVDDAGVLATTMQGMPMPATTAARKPPVGARRIRPAFRCTAPSSTAKATSSSSGTSGRRSTSAKARSRPSTPTARELHREVRR